MQNFAPRKFAKNLAVNIEKCIQFTSLCIMKVLEREISRQMKVSKTAVPNNIKNFKKSTFKDSKKNNKNKKKKNA